MKVLTILLVLLAGDAVAQCPGGCSMQSYPGFNGWIFSSQGQTFNSQGRTAFKPRVVERVEYAPRVTYQPHITYSPHVNYGNRAGDILSVPRVVRPPRAYSYQRRPQAYYYSDLNNYQGTFSYGVQQW